jgi:hypothetical protein
MILAAEAQIAPALKTAIQSAKVNIEIFHQAQLKKEEKIETMPGVWCWRKSVGIEKVGIYIPGGTAPLFSTVLMLGIPAKLAGCKEVVLCTPPRKDGTVDPAILFAASLVGIQQIYTIGGAQAIAAMAYGTASVPKVFKIFGPGNQYVTAAKQLVQQQGVPSNRHGRLGERPPDGLGGRPSSSGSCAQGCSPWRTHLCVPKPRKGATLDGECTEPSRRSCDRTDGLFRLRCGTFAAAFSTLRRNVLTPALLKPLPRPGADAPLPEQFQVRRDMRSALRLRRLALR